MSEVITIAIVAYNSSSTILQTLDSALTQTYQAKNIELLISDDGSSDATNTVISDWLQSNQHHFHRAVLYRNKENQGVSANCNVVWRNATGRWIKTIAADDILAATCISDNLNYIKEHPETQVLFSDAILFSGDLKNQKVAKNDQKLFAMTQVEQFNMLLKGCNILAPTSFMSKKALESVGFADERYAMLEDYPLWYKILKQGISLDYFEKETVYYRVGDSLSQHSEFIGNAKYLNSLYCFQRDCIWPELSYKYVFKIWDDYIIFKEKTLWLKFIGNKRSNTYLVYHYITCLFRPYRLYKMIRKFL